MRNEFAGAVGTWTCSLLPKEKRADVCIACGECEEKRPQQIEISGWMERAHEKLLFKENA